MVHDMCTEREIDEQRGQKGDRPQVALGIYVLSMS